MLPVERRIFSGHYGAFTAYSRLVRGIYGAKSKDFKRKISLVGELPKKYRYEEYEAVPNRVWLSACR